MFTLLRWTLLRIARRRFPLAEMWDPETALAGLLEYFEELVRDYPELYGDAPEPERLIAA